jgi:hypothetical protein
MRDRTKERKGKESNGRGVRALTWPAGPTRAERSVIVVCVSFCRSIRVGFGRRPTQRADDPARHRHAARCSSERARLSAARPGRIAENEAV